MPSNVVLRVGCRKVGGLGTAFLTIFLAVAFAIVLALAGCSGLVSSNSPSSNPPPPPISLSISTTSLPNGQANAAWSGTLTASGGTTPYTWSLASGSSLPSWLNLNASSGLLNGTPSAAGTVSFTLKVTDSSSTPQTATKSYSFSIAAAGPTPVSITTASLPNGQVGTAWSATLTASGGTTPYTWAASGSSLPSWLTLNASTGQLNGTPSAAGIVSFTLKVTDSSSTPQTASKSYSFSIAAAGPTPVSITTASLPNGQVGTAWSATLAASGGTTPYTWSLASGSSLPSWLTLNASTGQLSGTPSATGTVSFTLKVTDSSSTPQTATKPFSFTIAAGGPVPLQLLTTSLANGQVSMPYSALLTATGGVTPYSWSVGSGALPTGLTLGASNGQISGTPTTSASFPFTIQVKDSSSPAQMANQSFTVLINVATAGTPVTACGTLANSGTTYILQNDVSAAGTCFDIQGSNITLNLNGHTITYDTGRSSSVYGINVTASSGTRLTSSVAGGTVAQSTVCRINVLTQANTAGGCTTANPINGNSNIEVDHLTLVDYGLDNSAIRLSGGSAMSIHDNTICPYHTKSTLTHYAVFGEIHVLNFAGVGSITNNTIGTACMAVTGQPNGFGYVGIYMGAPGTQTQTLEITNNHISMAAPVRDGYAIEFGCSANTLIGFEVAFNTITQVSGRGILSAGFSDSSSPGCNTGTIHDNVVSVKEAGNEGYSNGDPLGIQLRFGAHNTQIYNNNITVYSGPGVCPAQFFSDSGSDCISQGAIKLMGGTNAANNQASNNTITAITTSANYPVSAIYGDYAPPDTLSGFFGNTITSNGIIVDVSQPDGCGNNWTFKNNTFIEGPNPLSFLSYHPVWFCNPGQSTNNNVFIDNTWLGPDNNPDNINGPPAGAGGSFSYFIRWSYNVTVTNSNAMPVPGATVSALATSGGTETITGTTDANGKATLVLTDHSASGTSSSSPTMVNYTPHSITISKTGCTTLTYTKSIKATTSDSQVLQGSGCS